MLTGVEVEQLISGYAQTDRKRIRNLPRIVMLAGGISNVCFAVTTGIAVELYMKGEPVMSDVNLKTRLMVAISLGILGLFVFVMQFRRKNDLDRVLAASPIELYQYIGKMNADKAEHEDECSSLKQDIALLEEALVGRELWIELYQYIQQAVEEYATYVNPPRGHTIPSSRDVERRFSAFLDSVVGALERDLGELLGYDSEEIYFIDVFELKRDNYLHRIARRKTSGAVSYNRHWFVGRGNVGMCIMKNSSVYVPYNPNDPDHKEPTDREYFKSVIVSRIPAIERKPHPAYGAICITSSMENGLEVSHVPYVATVAYLLASAFAARDKALARRNRSPSQSEEHSDGGFDNGVASV